MRDTYDLLINSLSLSLPSSSAAPSPSFLSSPFCSMFLEVVYASFCPLVSSSFYLSVILTPFLNNTLYNISPNPGLYSSTFFIRLKVRSFSKLFTADLIGPVYPQCPPQVSILNTVHSLVFTIVILLHSDDL